MLPTPYVTNSAKILMADEARKQFLKDTKKAKINERDTRFAKKKQTKGRKVGSAACVAAIMT